MTRRPSHRTGRADPATGAAVAPLPKELRDAQGHLGPPPPPPPPSCGGATAHVGRRARRSQAVLVRFGDRVLIVDDTVAPQGTAPSTGRTRAATKGLAPGSVDREVVASLSETERLGLDALTMRRTKAWGRVKANRPRAGEPWDMVSCDGLRPRLDDGKLRDLLPDVMPGAQEEGEAAILRDLPGPAEGLNDYLEGPVAVSVVFVNGPTAAVQMSAAERLKVVAEIQEGYAWLAAANPSAHLSFTVETHTVSITTADATGLAELVCSGVLEVGP